MPDHDNMSDKPHTAPSSPAPIPAAGNTQNMRKRMRLAALAEANRLPRARVLPTSDAIRATLRHANGVAFRDTGSVEWPYDKFTQCRVADGSVTIETMLDDKAESKPEAYKPDQVHKPDAPKHV